MKKGFTLTELLVVIAIIGVLGLLVVPSVLSVNKNINKRLLDNKKEHIESAAELYGSNHEDIFYGTDEVEIKVGELLKNSYLEVDATQNGTTCTDATGCVINPETQASMNNDIVVLKKTAAGITATYASTAINTSDVDESLVKKVCDQIKNGTYTAYTYEAGAANDRVACSCTYAGDEVINIVKAGTSQTVDACVIAGGGETNNWLKYGDTEANWRVLGIYNIGTASEPDLSIKIVTNETIN